MKKVLVLFVLVLLLSAARVCGADWTIDQFLAGQYYNNLATDSFFTDVNAMTAMEIQSFLASRNSILKDYVDTSTMGAGRTAAEIIYDSSHGLYSAAVGTEKGIVIDSATGTISPIAILIMLQSERFLVGSTISNNKAVDYAMGYGWTDGVGDNPAYAGFAMQVGIGAWQLRYNFEAAKKDADWWNANYGVGNAFYIGQTKVLSDCTGDYTVTFTSAATASIYRYRPTVFNGGYGFWVAKNTYFPESVPEPSSLFSFLSLAFGIRFTFCRKR